MTARRARRAALAMTLTAALGVGTIAGVATAQKAKPPAKRSVSASGTALAFSKTKLTAPRGRVQLILNNKSPITHNIAIRGNGLKAKLGPIVTQGKQSKVTATVKPGRYTYFCSVGGHEAAGMKGTLTVPKPKAR